MKILKKIIAGLVVAAMVAALLPAGMIPIRASAAEGNPLRLWYDEPSSQGTNILSAGSGYSDYDGSNRWQQQTLPIGNGDMGANVYGEIVSEHLTFNEKTLWTGGPSTSRPNYKGGNLESKGQNGAMMKQIQELFLEGNSSYASSLCGSYLVGDSNGYGAYQAWGDIYFDFAGLSSSVTNYQRDLDLTTGIASVSFTHSGTDYYREFFISHDDNVLVARLEANGSAKLNLDVRFPSKQGGTTKVEGDNTLVLCGQVSDNQLKYASYLTVVPEGGSVTGSGSKLTVTDADAVTVYLSAATDYKNTFWNEEKTDDYYYRTGETDAELAERVQADVLTAALSGYEAVKESHLADYQGLFNRLSLDIGQTVSDKTTDQLLAAYKNGSATAAEQRQLEVMLFQYGRYLTIASSREDSQLPSNLQGVWNYMNNPPWSSDYHMNVNLQMNYWPTYSTNLAECALPLIDYVDSLREPGRITAAIYNGVVSGEGEANGFSAHTQNTPFGWTCPGWSFDWGWSPAAVPWIIQNCWEYYEYTGDVEFMREYIYPMLKEEALFYDATMVRDADGKLVSAPSYSPEHGPRTAGNTYEQSLAWQLYEDAIIAAETLGVDADLVATWKANQADLKGPIEVGDDGQLKEWYEETTLDSMKSQGADPAGHRHISHMLGLFPGDLVQRNDEWVAAAKVSMDYRTDNSTGWGMGQRINTWARLGEGNKAHELIQNLFKGGIYPNLWDSHAPFQIDGNFGMTSGVAEMLMQSNMGFINLLPALPDVWAEGSVNGLVARGNFEIAMDWTKGGITNATILSNNGGEAIVLADNITLATVTDGSGNEVEFTVTEDGKISFDTVAGETYTLTIPERPDAPANLAVLREGLEAANLTWNAVDGASYNVYRASGAADPVQIASGLTETAYTDAELDTEAPSVTYYVSAVVGGIESILSTGITLTAPAGYGMIDNLDQRIAYAGGWANWSESVNYNGSIMYLEGDAYSTDATVTLQFIGTGIEVITCTNHDRSYFEVIIDGESCGEVDTYSASTVRQVKIFSKDDLEYGMHTIVLKPMEQNNPSCSRNGTYKLELDAFNVLDAVATAPEEGEVNLLVGESATYTDETGYYVDADTSALDTSIATVELSGEVTGYEQTLSEKVTGVNDGKTYVFLNKVAGKLVSNEWADASVGGGGSDGLALGSTLENFDENDLWTITAAEGGWYVQDQNGKYMSIARGKGLVKDEPVVIDLNFDGTDWTIGENGEYANDFGGAHTAVAGWSDINDVNSQWEIYEVSSVALGTTTITFTGVSAGETSVQIGDILYQITVSEPYTDPADSSRDIPLSVLEVSTGDYEKNGMQYNEGPAEFAVDNDPSSLWHTDWYGTSRENHWFQFELTDTYSVDGLRYWPRQAGNTNGTITEYKIQVSDDGENFRDVASGTWEADRNWKIAKFDGETVKYVRLVAVDALTDNQYVFASASEIRITGVKTDAPPVVGHTFENGFCTDCGIFEEAILNEGIYEIGNAGQLFWFAELVNGGEQDANAILTSNITIGAGHAWTPVAQFAGTFDGNGKTISGLSVNETSEIYTGFIARLNEGGVVKNVTVSESTFQSSQSVGAVVGYNAGLVEYCTNTSAVTSTYKNVGGVVGYNIGIVSGCSNSGAVQGSSSVGGVVGYSIGDVNGCSNSGTVAGSSELGGIVGFARGNVIKSYNTGAIGTTANNGNYVGGIVGMGGNDIEVAIRECYNTGIITGSKQVGGIAGQIGGTTPQGNTSINIAMTVEDCYNEGNLVGVGSTSNNMGGIVGYLYNADSSVIDCYNVGTVKAAGSYAAYTGGIAGRSSGTVQNSFYLTGCAKDGKSKAQFGIGSNRAGSTTADVAGATTGVTAAVFASGEVTYLLNGSTSEGELVWKQTIGTDAAPKFEGAVVYYHAADNTYSNEAPTECVHTPAEAVIENNVDPTCTDAGSYDSVVYCSECGEEISRETISVEALGHNAVAVPGKDATCTETGLTEGSKCDRCGETLVEQKVVDALGHTEEVLPAVAPTCTETGLTEGKKCSVCGEILVAQEEIAALGHTEEVIPGKDATCTETGLTEGKKCSVCGEILVAQEEIPALGHDWHGTGCSRCDATRENPFTDVPEDSFYIDPVLWAVEKGITNGATDTTFNPNGNCMRAHVVTFLWRAAGSPEPTSTNNPFVDVKETDFYYKAVLWAVENEITNGLDATHFGPTADCNRAQVVTFLWRAMNKPAPTEANHPFTDVVEGQFYYDAMLWAVENGITNGLTETTFGPNALCNRAQVVTFLYRTYVK